MNNEHIKTSRAGRNMAIFGVAYEIVYTDEGKKVANKGKVESGSEVKFIAVDPREIILIYDYSPEPVKRYGIHYVKMDSETYIVELYMPESITRMEMTVDDSGKWVIGNKETFKNFFNDIPIVPYYFGDDMLGVIEPVMRLIDANDVLFSDSMNEFDRFAYAYLIMKKYGLTDTTKMKDPASFSKALAFLKRTRIFEHVPADADIKFLTKDVPYEFIQFMTDIVREQIHIQSHVPDFTSEKLSQASGIAIQRLLFDFENMVSSVEADFDLGLLERIRLINIIYAYKNMYAGSFDDITISHKRNVPLNLAEFADTAKTMKEAGFSSWLCCDIMPDDIIPDVQAELARQKKENEEMIPDIENNYTHMEEPEEEDDGPEEEDEDE